MSHVSENEPPATRCRARLGDRSLFETLEARAYLDHAAISPASAAVRDQVARVVDDYARGGLVGFKTWLPQRRRLKSKLATLVGCNLEDLGFVPNTTAGVVDVALCFPWKRGDRVLLFAGDFPANVTPWQRAAELFGLEVVWLSVDPFTRSNEEGLAALEQALRQGVRLVATSFVRFQTGLRLPVNAMGELAHHHGAELFVDGIQGIGVAPFDVTHVDYLSCGGHKWLMGLEGAGFLYVDPQRVAALEPRVAGWLGHQNALDFLFLGEGHLRHDRPIREETSIVEQGAQNSLGCAALEASVDLIQQLGVDTIFAHVQRYHDALEPELLARGFHSERVLHGRSGSLTVRVPEGVDLLALHASLVADDIACTTPDGRLRFAPHWPNAIAEVPLVVEAIDRGLRGGIREAR